MEDSLSAGDFPFSVKAPRWVGYSYMVGLSLPWPKVVDVIFCIHVLFRFLLFSLLLLVAPNILYHYKLEASTYREVFLRLPYICFSFFFTFCISNMPDFHTKTAGLLPAMLLDMKFCVVCLFFLHLLDSICSNFRHIMLICIH